MPIISNSTKELYESLYKKLKNKYSPVSVYLTDKDILDEKEKAIGKAMEDFINLYEKMESSFSVKGDMQKSENGVIYSNDDYSKVKANMAKDDELGAQLEVAVENIRGKLLKLVEGMIGPGYNYENEKDNPIDKEKFTALNYSVSDRMGDWKNQAIDKEIARRKRVDLEFAHRPEVFLREKDPKTKKVRTIKAERYVPYKVKFSPEYRFFNRETSYIQYDRAQDPDAYTTAILGLRDILENHKERKNESDRRREYVKFINNQHQAYAVWKEQMPKEKEKYEKIVMSLSEDTRKRYEKAMENYNSMTSMFSGIDNWLEQEKIDYLARKKVLEEAESVTDKAFKEYENAKSPYEEYLKEMEEERTQAEKELNVLRSNPLLDESYISEQNAILKNFSKVQQELVFDLERLEEEIQNDIVKQDEARQKLMSESDKVNAYKEEVAKLKESQSKANYKAVKNYYGMLFEGEVQLSSELTAQQKELQTHIDKRLALEKDLEIESTNLINAEASLIQIRAQLKQDEESLECAKAFALERTSAEIKELNNYMKEIKGDISKNKLPEDEARESFARGCAMFAAYQNWDIGTDIIYLDVTEAKALQARIKENKLLLEKSTKEYKEKEDKYKEVVEKIEDIKATITNSESIIDQLTGKLDDLQSADRDKNVDNLMKDIENKETTETNEKGRVLTDAEKAIEKQFDELGEQIRKKMELRTIKQNELSTVEQQHIDAEKNLQTSDNLKVHLQEQEQKYKELVEKQEQKKKQLETAKENAYNAYMSKEMDNEKVKEQNEKFVQEYELIQKKLEEGEGSSLRRLQDLSELVQEQQSKLTIDAEKQKKYMHRKEDVFCEKLRKQLVEMKLRLLAVAQPSGLLKRTNTKEFTEFKNTCMQFLEPKINEEDNPFYILDKLETVNATYATSDEEREKLMKEVSKALEKITKETDNYLKAKGSPHRNTEMGRARYQLASEISTLCTDANSELKEMLFEQECRKIAPDLSKATAKSGLNVSYDRTDGYRYSSDVINKESDIFSPDAFREKKENNAPVVTTV